MKNDFGLQPFNSWNEKTAREELSRCCGASKWVSKMMESRPFEDEEALFECGEASFESLTRADWLEAFAHHPKIGDIDSLRQKFAATSDWAGEEQAGASAASEATLSALSQGNRNYEAKFGWIFIICATGKSAEAMLLALQERLENDAETEISNAAEQQKQITRLRLGKLLG